MRLTPTMPAEGLIGKKGGFFGCSLDFVLAQLLAPLLLHLPEIVEIYAKARRLGRYRVPIVVAVFGRRIPVVRRITFIVDRRHRLPFL